MTTDRDALHVELNNIASRLPPKVRTSIARRGFEEELWAMVREGQLNVAWEGNEAVFTLPDHGDEAAS